MKRLSPSDRRNHRHKEEPLNGKVLQGFLGVDDAAEILGVSKATLYRWVHERRITFRKHGSRLVFCPQELRAWSDCRRQEPIRPFAAVPHSARTEQSGKMGSLKSREKEWSPTSQPGGS